MIQDGFPSLASSFSSSTLVGDSFDNDSLYSNLQSSSSSGSSSSSSSSSGLESPATVKFKPPDSIDMVQLTALLSQSPVSVILNLSRIKQNAFESIAPVLSACWTASTQYQKASILFIIADCCLQSYNQLFQQMVTNTITTQNKFCLEDDLEEFTFPKPFASPLHISPIYLKHLYLVLYHTQFYYRCSFALVHWPETAVQLGILEIIRGFILGKTLKFKESCVLQSSQWFKIALEIDPHCNAAQKNLAEIHPK